jgi:protein O-mannosyl-transferase
MSKKRHVKQPANHPNSLSERSIPAPKNKQNRSFLHKPLNHSDSHFWDTFAKWQPWYVLVPVILALLTSINGLGNDFAFDDNYQVLGNDFIKDLSNLPSAFTSSVWAFLGNDLIASQDSYFRPLFTVLFSINYALFGTQAVGWHLVNLAIHLAVTYFVFLVCRAISGRDRLALIAASIFAVHPAHAESVAWISGITDPLMALFLLPSFLFYLRYKKNGRKRELAAMLFLFFLAVMSKEAAILLPVIIAYCELVYFKERAPLRQRLSQLGMLAVYFLLPVAIYFAMRYSTFGTLVSKASVRYSPLVVITTIPLIFVKYLKLMFIPTGYSILHFTAPGPSIASPDFFVPLVLIVALVGVLFFTKSRLLGFASMWFILWLSLSLWGVSVFQPLYSVQERYLYVPSIGVCIALALGIERIASLRFLQSYGPLAAGLVTICLIIIFSITYIKQNEVWQNDISLNQNAVAVDPQNPLSHSSLAAAYFSRRNFQEAKLHAQRALDIDPNCIDAYLQLSVLAHSEGKIDSGIQYLEQAKARVPEGHQKRGYLSKIYMKLGFLYNEKKDYKKAEENLQRTVELTPFITAWYELGKFYLQQGDNEKALEMFEKVVAGANPNFAPIHLDLARAYDRLGQLERAKNEYRLYVKLAPYSKDRDEALQRLMQLQH